jgi:acetyl-CoA synthetase
MGRPPAASPLNNKGWGMIACEYDAAGKALRCRFSGHMDSKASSADAAEFEAQLARIHPAGSPAPAGLSILFDLGKVDFVASAFMRLCFVAAKRVAAGKFSITRATPQVQEMLRMAGLDQVTTMESVLHETRVFPPPAAFSAQARVKTMAEYEALHKASLADPDAFWADQAARRLAWLAPWKTVCEWKPPFAKWFVGGRLNVAANCLDRHLGTATANKAALIWEGEPGGGRPGEERTLTYRQLHREVCLFANVLKRQGVVAGDRVLIYLPMVPEAAVAMLACARIGAIHSVVFGGFSAQSVAERVADCQAKIIVTADGSFRRGAIVPLKKNVDDAFQILDPDGKPLCACIQRVIVLRRAGNEVVMAENRDVWWQQQLQYVGADCPAEPVESEHPLFILYTSGSTGKPKGIVHSSAGYLLGAALSHELIFDLRDSDVYWCTADVGWITGHSYIVYGPLANGATVFMYEGAPNYPEPDRYWRLIAKYGVTVFYTAPTAIRAFMKWGSEWPKKHDLSSLRLLGSVGEPINPEAWMWYHETIGGGRCPIVDTWWQTETGSIMIAPLPGAFPLKPGCATRPFLGVDAAVVDETGAPAKPNAGGKLIIRKPWPSMLRGVWGDPQRYREVYWSEVPGAYCTGDSARQDEDGYISIVGRLDDVLNVSGHRIGTAEVEGALVSHKTVAEAAVVGRPDDIKGSALVAFVTLKSGVAPSPELREELKRQVAAEIGPVAKPDEIRFTESLPKTRSGKIMRRLLKQIAAGTEIRGDLTTLEDFSVLTKLQEEG